ncbi:MAG: hypothetical protein QW379_01520 [Thermoplasmata archaeon]
MKSTINRQERIEKPSMVKKRKKKSKCEILHWSSAISFNAQSTASVLRKLLNEMGLSFRRERSEKPYSQLYAIVPIPKFAYVFRFIITAQPPLVIDLYDIHPSTSGALSFIEIPELNDENIDLARNILRQLAKSLPRSPWEFTWLQRIQHGLLNPDILKARNNWRALGISL